AVAPSLHLNHEDIAVILAAINLLGLAMFFVVVAVSDALQLDPIAAGIWAGSAIHAVPQAIAAGEAIGPEGLAVATAVKLSRVSLLVVVVPLFGILGRRLNRDQASDVGPTNWKTALKLPLFVPGFVLAVVVGNLLLPDDAADGLGYGGRILLLPVLAAVGLAVTRTTLKQTGGRVFLVGVLSTVALASASLAVVMALYD
ncbi:MAG: putative sulfate exporter family transporter, partial [Chloroflexi bacterium]|nr:putative sulfate exporter family transporter [Chloroflexota bacterium]